MVRGRSPRLPDPEPPRRRKARTPEAREQQLVASAIDLAEKQIREGTAPSQVVLHYLKLGSSREHLEQERLRHENELLVARREAMAQVSRIEELYIGAIAAMRSYKGEAPMHIESERDDDD